MNDAENEPPLQAGRGQKRSIDEVNDGARTFDEVSNNNFFTMTDVKQVKVKKFNTTGMDYTVQFTDTFAHLELSEFQKGEKGGMTNTKMYTFLEQNIVGKAFLWLHKLKHKLTFGIIYFLKI